MSADKIGDLRVWWIPQIPGKQFTVPVDTPAEAAKLIDVLAKYDLFQFENRIKPDYCNMGGLVVCEDDGDGGTEWCDWYDEETGEDIYGWAQIHAYAGRGTDDEEANR